MSQNRIKKIKKRDGTIADFDQSKITNAILKSITAIGQADGRKSRKISDKVVQILNRRFRKDEIPNVEQIQDIIEEVLILENLVETAKAYILYREQRRRIREAVAISEESVERMDQYLEKLDWEVQENANMAFSLQGLNHYSVSYIVKKYWLNKIYPQEIREANESGDFHVHNLDTLGPYCAGWDLYDLLLKGFCGVPGKVETKPAKHFRAALGQLVNFLYTLQGEVAGAVAVSNFDTLLAPFIRYDNLNYQQTKQALQEFLFNMAVPTRVGFQCPFSNITLDLKPSSVFAKQPVIIGGKPQKEIYAEFEEEMKIFDKAFYETMLEGDKSGRPFHFPIPTINITKDFPWDNPAYDLIFEASAKYGTNYFANYINSDMEPSDSRSMCCRLKLDLRELYNRGGGGLFGAGNKTGCYDDKTEILTEDGWKFFKDLTLKDEVFTLTEDNKIELHKPSQFFEYDYQGKMIHFKGRSFDLLVTPNHRMVVDHKHKNKRMFVEAKDFKKYQHFIPKGGIWEGEEKEYFILPPVEIFKGTGSVSRFSENELEVIRQTRKEGVAYYKIAEEFDCNVVTISNICAKSNYGQHKLWSYQTEPIKIKMDDWLRFFGFWTAEGCTDNENSALDHGYRVVITQTNKQKREEIKEVLDVLPFNYYEEKNNLVICNKQLWTYLCQFGNTYTKFVPKEIKNLNKRQLRILFDWVIKGDGHIRKTTGQINYWTSSKRLADDLQEIILKLGWTGTLTVPKRRVSQIKGREINAGITYTIGVHQKTKHYSFNKKRIIEEVDYKGKVYCCEVPNHTVFVRRNEKVSWCGNSIGVVTINLPRIGYLSKTKKEFFEKLAKVMYLAKESLEIKRKTIENFIEKGLYPYSRFYLADIKKARGEYYANHFATIGLVGMNEAILNFIGENIGSKRGRNFALEVLDFMRKKLVKYQEQTKNIYNLEATPAESTAYRLALKDREKYPDIITAGTKKVPYYTNSSHLPVNYTNDSFEALKLQDELQCLYNGGCIEKGNKVLTDKGLLKIEDIVKNFGKLRPIKALSYNKEKSISEWDEVVEAVKVDVKKYNKIRIRGERNLDIATSDWHPFFVLERFKPNPACPICEEKVGNLKGFAVHIRWNPECQEEYKKFPKYKILEKRADELKVGDYILQNSYNLYSEKETELNNDLMWLFGFFIGDGCISKFIDNRGGNNLERYKIRFFSEHQEALNRIATVLNKYFNCRVKVIQNEKRSKLLREVSTSKKEVSAFFFKYGFEPEEKVYKIFIPQRVKENFTKKNVFSFLAGLMDSDGHLNKKDGYLEYYTVSSKLAEDLLEFFSLAGIMISKTQKKTKRNNEVDIWRLRVPQYEITKIKDQLTNTFHLSRIKKELSNRKRRYLPVVRVKKVSKVDVEDNQFYDLMTEKNHNYLAGKDCLVFVHNTVLHLFLGERINNVETVKILVKKVFENFHLPYITLTPTFSICPSHGYLEGEHFYCPQCTIKQPCEVYSRVVGYLRPVNQFNIGKQQEFRERKTFKISKSTL